MNLVRDRSDPLQFGSQSEGVLPKPEELDVVDVSVFADLSRFAIENGFIDERTGNKVMDVIVDPSHVFVKGRGRYLQRSDASPHDLLEIVDPLVQLLPRTPKNDSGKLGIAFDMRRLLPGESQPTPLIHHDTGLGGDGLAVSTDIGTNYYYGELLGRDLKRYIRSREAAERAGTPEDFKRETTRFDAYVRKLHRKDRVSLFQPEPLKAVTFSKKSPHNSPTNTLGHPIERGHVVLINDPLRSY